MGQSGHLLRTLTIELRIRETFRKVGTRIRGNGHTEFLILIQGLLLADLEAGSLVGTDVLVCHSCVVQGESELCLKEDIQDVHWSLLGSKIARLLQTIETLR